MRGFNDKSCKRYEEIRELRLKSAPAPYGNDGSIAAVERSFRGALYLKMPGDD